jgi:hypothetical protein
MIIGRLIQQPTGYKAFIPDKFPPDQPIGLNTKTQQSCRMPSIFSAPLDWLELYKANHHRKGWKMQFFKALLRNLGLLIIIGVVLLIIFPGTMSQVFRLYGALFGPLVIVMLVVGALPHKRRRY